MLKITILPDNVRRSLFSFNDSPDRILDELPEKLLLRVTRVLTILAKYNVMVIKSDRHTRELNYSCTELGYPLPPLVGRMSEEDSIFEVTDVLDGFDWFLSPRLCARDPDRIGGPLVCSDCHQSQPQAMSADGFCKNPFCPSHAKLAEIIEGYVPPENKLAKVFAGPSITHSQQQDEGVDSATPQKKLVEQAFAGIPRTGNQNEWLEKANSWVQKG